MPSNLNSYVKINETVSAQSREVNPFLNDIPIELISYEDSNNLLTSLNITTGLGNTDKRRTLAKALGFFFCFMLALGASGSRRSPTPIYKKIALSGSWTFAANNTSINGTGGNLLTGDELRVNEVVFTAAGLSSQVQSVNSDNQFILYVPLEVSGTSVTLYKMIPLSDYIGQIELTTLGYLYSRLSFTNAVLNYYTICNVSGYVVLVPSNTLTVTGAAGWRYIVCNSLGIVSVETIPVAEIVADTIQYTPTPVFNSTLNGYYSTVNPTKRIIGVAYFDGTNLITIKPYGIGSKKNDDYWETTQAGISATAANTRLQFTGTWEKTWGTNIVCVDNGGYVSGNDNEGFRITFQKSGKGRIGVNCTQEGTGTALNKNGVMYKQYIFYSNVSNNNAFVSIDVDVSAGDYFTFVNAGSSISAAISYFTISFEEN